MPAPLGLMARFRSREERGPAGRARRPRRAPRGLPALDWHRRVLIILIVLGLVSGLPDLAARVHTEQANRRVELVADETTFVQFAQQNGIAPTTLLQRLKAVGVQGLGVSEDTLDSLDQQGLLTVLSGAAWTDAARAAGASVPGAGFVNPNGTYVLIPAGPGQRSLSRFVVSGLSAALAPGITVTQRLFGSELAIGIPQPPGVVALLPLGFRPASFALAQSVGLDVVPRPQGTQQGYTVAALKSLFASIASAGVPVHTVLFAGASTDPVPGYPDNLAMVGNLLVNAGWNLGVLETPSQLSNVDQPGTRRLDALMQERTVRVYSVPPWLLQQYGQSQAVTSLVGGVIERNMRILYLHPITTGINQVARTVALYQGVAQVLQADGMHLAPPQPYAAVRVHTVQRALQSLAVVAAGLWLLELLFPALRRYGYQPLAVLGVLALLLAVGSRTLSVELVGMAAASVGGGLSVYYLASLWHRWAWPKQLPTFGWIWRRGVLAMAATAGITFLGALTVATLLGDTPHILAWQYFRGVKVTYLMIPFLSVLAFGATVGFSDAERRELWPQIRWLGGQSVNYRQIAAYLLVAAIGAVYLLRSGNVSAHLVPGIEVKMRDFLESHLTFRPREKEFLVGYPSLLLAMLFAGRRQRWAFLFFLVGASVSQVSLVDAFEHIRTPFVNTLLRETYGWLLGLLTGTAALLVFWGAFRLWDRQWRRGLPDAEAPAPPR